MVENRVGDKIPVPPIDYGQKIRGKFDVRDWIPDQKGILLALCMAASFSAMLIVGIVIAATVR